MPKGQYDRSKMKKPVKESLDSVRYGFVPPGLKKERDEFITKALQANPNLSYEKMKTVLQESSMAGIGVKTFASMKKSFIKQAVREAKPVTTRLVVAETCAPKPFDINLKELGYTSVRLLNGSALIAEFPVQA